jgi:hypothetical protein
MLFVYEVCVFVTHSRGCEKNDAVDNLVSGGRVAQAWHKSCMYESGELRRTGLGASLKAITRGLDNTTMM